MAKKNIGPTKEQKEVMKANGLKDYLWEVLQDLPASLIVKHRINGDVKLIEKKGVKV